MKGHENHKGGHKGGKKHVFADGGVIDKDKSPTEVYAGKGSHVEHEAEEKKDGGRLKRKLGGRVEGKKPHHLLHRPGRARGGGVGADMRPLSSAHRGTAAKGHKADAGPAEGH